MESGPDSCHIQGMTKHPKRPRDVNQLAKMIVDEATKSDDANKKREPRKVAPAEKLHKNQRPGSSGGTKTMGIVSP